MSNPFAEDPGGEDADAALVERAKDGDRDALEQLVLRHQAWVYNIALRMVFQPQDAEEVTQEVLVKVVTRLANFRGESRFRTWLYRIVAHHVLNMRRRGAEAVAPTFEAYGAALEGTPDLDLPDPRSVPVDVALLVEEAKVSCTMGMLLCLDRKQRSSSRSARSSGRATRWGRRSSIRLRSTSASRWRARAATSRAS